MRYSLPYIRENYSSFIKQLVVSKQFSRFVTDSASLLEDLGELYLEESVTHSNRINSLYELIQELERKNLFVLDIMEEIDEDLQLELSKMFVKLDKFRDDVRNRYAHSIEERKDINHREIMELFPYIFGCLQSIEAELLLIFHRKHRHIAHLLFNSTYKYKY